MKRYYLIYQITNNINSKIYIGKHETNNLDDDYFGSGKLLILAQKKYGLENFRKTILFYCADKEEMDLLEACVVTPEFCNRSDVYNITVGGNGSWYYVNEVLHLNGDKMFKSGRSQESIQQQYFNAAKASREYWKKLSFKEYQIKCKQISIRKIEWNQRHPGYYAGKRNPMYGHVDTIETHNKKVLGQLGEKNSQYGKMWICNDLTKESVRIMKTDPIPKGWRKGRFCKR